MTPLHAVIARLAATETGQDLIEYGLLAALIALVAMVSVTALGDTVYTIFWKQIGQAL
jgi:Flp pilus assembly pilin Flp